MSIHTRRRDERHSPVPRGMPSTIHGRRPLTVPEAAEARHSVRSYRPTPIPRSDLNEILRLTGLAPSAHNLQPWRFVVVEDPEAKARLQEAAYGQRQVGSAPAVIVLYSDMADTLAHLDEVVHPGIPAGRRQETVDSLAGSFGARTVTECEEWGAGQSYIALGYLLLAATALGYGTSAMLGFDPEAVKDLLGLPAHARIPALVAIGIPDEDGFPHHRHPTGRIARFA